QACRAEPKQQPPRVEAFAPRQERDPSTVQMDQHRPTAVTALPPVEVEAVAASGGAVAEIGDADHAGMEDGKWGEHDPGPWRPPCDRLEGSCVSPVRSDRLIECLFDCMGCTKAAAHENGHAGEREDG